MVEKKETGQPHWVFSFPPPFFFFSVLLLFLFSSLPPTISPLPQARTSCFADQPRRAPWLLQLWGAGPVHRLRWKRASLEMLVMGWWDRPRNPAAVFASFLSMGWVLLQMSCRCKRSQGMAIFIYQGWRRWVAEIFWGWAPVKGVFVCSAQRQSCLFLESHDTFAMKQIKPKVTPCLEPYSRRCFHSHVPGSAFGNISKI